MGRSKVKTQMANVKSDGILPFDLCDLHFDLPFDASKLRQGGCALYTQHYEAAKRAGQKSKVKRQMANVKSDAVLPFDLCDLHFD